MRKKWKWIALSVLALLVVIIGFVVWRGWQTYDQIDQMSKPKEESRFGHFEQVPEYQPPEWTGTERVNILLMGGDERGLRKGEVPHSDTMLVVSFDPETKKVHLFSVLRDTWVKIPGRGNGRINTALPLGGPELAMKTVGDLTGLNIQYYVYADFQGFIKLIDALGGIDYYVEKNMRWTDSADGHRYDIDLKEGWQHLDGEKALQYVRFRHDALSDYSRTERQRKFLAAVADKLKSGWSLVRLPDILAEVTPYIETNMSPEQILRLGTLGYRSKHAGSAQIPPMELLREETIGGSQVITVRDLDDLKAFVEYTLAQEDTPERQEAPSASPDAASGANGR